MYAEIQGGFTALKTALDLAKAGKGMIDQAAMASALYEIQQKLMETQTAALQAAEENATLSKRVRELEGRLETRDEWKNEAAKYELTDVAPGIKAWTERGRKEKMADALKLCANCFGQHEISILQTQREQANREHSLRCSRCKDKLIFRYFNDTQNPPTD